MNHQYKVWMKTYKKLLIITIIVAGVGCLSWMLWVCFFREYYTVEKIKLPNGKHLVITSDTWWEIHHLLFYHVKENQEERIFFAGSLDDPDSLTFKTLIADGGSVVGIVEEYRPDILLILLDLRGARSDQEMTSLLEHETGRKYILAGEYRWDDEKPPRAGL